MEEGLEAIAGVQKKKQTPTNGFKKGVSGNPSGRRIRLSDAGGYIDLLAEFEWRLNNPNETPKTPPQKMVLAFYQKNFEHFVTQYNELKREKLDKELASRPVMDGGSDRGKLELNERDLTIDEAIDRVLTQLEEMENGTGS